MQARYKQALTDEGYEALAENVSAKTAASGKKRRKGKLKEWIAVHHVADALAQTLDADTYRTVREALERFEASPVDEHSLADWEQEKRQVAGQVAKQMRSMNRGQR